MPLTVPTPLGPNHDRDAFACGEPSLDEWLKHRARRNESRFSRTYVICDGDRVIGYHCVSAGAISRPLAPGRARRDAPDLIPVSIIGRLAVDTGYVGRGVGGDLLWDALSRTAAASRSIGIGAVMVQAKDERAKRFYLACAEFQAFPADSRTLFLPIETVVDVVG